MNDEERAKTAAELLRIRQEIDALYGAVFGAFVQSVHDFGNMLKPLVIQHQALAHKLEELEAKINATSE